MATTRKPLLLTPALRDAIVDSIRKGLPRTSAAQQYGVSSIVMRAWMYRGTLVDDLGHPMFPEHHSFATAVERAESGVELELVEHVKAACEKDWKAAMALLTVLRPKTWNQKQVAEAAARSDVEEQLLDIIQRALGPAAYQIVLEHLVEGKPLPENFTGEAPIAVVGAPRLDS